MGLNTVNCGLNENLLFFYFGKKWVFFPLNSIFNKCYVGLYFSLLAGIHVYFCAIVYTCAVMLSVFYSYIWM